MYILLPVVMCLPVCVHIDGLARDCGSSSANALELSRSRARPWMYMLMCGCVCVCVCFAHLCLCALFIYSRTIAHRANVICCTYIYICCTYTYLILSYLILWRFLAIYLMLWLWFLVIPPSFEPKNSYNKWSHWRLANWQISTNAHIKISNTNPQ